MYLKVCQGEQPCRVFTGTHSFRFTLHPVELTGFHYSNLGEVSFATPSLFAKGRGHALYFLSVVLVRSFRWTGVTRYGALWCPDFPPASPSIDDGHGRSPCGLP